MSENEPKKASGKGRRKAGSGPADDPVSTLTRDASPGDKVRTAAAAVKLRAVQEERARAAERGNRAAKAARINFIIEEMLADRWDAKTRKATALRFGVGKDSIRDDAAEASRRISGLTLSDDVIKARMEHALDELLDLARDAARHGDVRAIGEGARVIGTWAAIRGVEAPKTLNVGGTLADFLSLGTAPKSG
jgi:hypothetical protein